MGKRSRKALKIAGVALLLFLAVRMLGPAWTPCIKGENSISELAKVKINGVRLQIMIRGSDRSNPVVLFVHGGPCCSEIPYARSYQKSLEEAFTIVHYDQRGSGKSYEFGEDYAAVTASTHAGDLIALTEYVQAYLEKEQVILVGHSYGTYIATMAAARRPDLYQAYIGIGQMSDTVESECISLEKCIAAAESAGKTADAAYLKGLKPAVLRGETIAPRDYLRKYGFAARKIDENADYIKAFLWGPEYTLLDVIRFYTASIQYQDALIAQALRRPITGLVTEIDLPVYFVMGKYDGMTSPESAKRYLQSLTGEGAKEFILFDESAHYPQLEEAEAFCQWMKSTFCDSAL